MSISRNKSLIFIIAFLVLTNIAVLVYFLRPGKKDHDDDRKGGRNGLATALQNEVGFDDEQVARYRELREEQLKIMRPLMDDIRRSKDSMFRMLGNDAITDSVLDRMAQDIADKQKQMDIRAFNHFKRIRLICRPDQLARYDSVVVKMIRKMGKAGKTEHTARPKN